MWDSKIFDQWRSYLSLKTDILVIFFIVWNAGFLFSIYRNGWIFEFDDTNKLPVSIVLLLASVFAYVVAFSNYAREKMIEPKRAHNFRKKDFYFLGFIALILCVAFYWF